MRSAFVVLLVKILLLAFYVGWRRLRGRQPRAGTTPQPPDGNLETRLHGLADHGPDRPSGWRMEVLAEMLRADRGFAADEEPSAVRSKERASPLTPGLRRQVRLERDAAGGVDGLWVTPHGWRPGGPTLLYFHGGGYCLCSPRTHRSLVAALAVTGGARAFVPDYRLAPEHPHPAAVEDAVAVYAALLESGVAPETLFLGGDSAGGGLTLATLLDAKASGAPLPRGAILLSPWVDLTLSGASVDGNTATDFLSRKSLSFYAERYLGDTDPKTPSASPLHGDLAGLPPLLIQLGGAETLLSEGQDLATRAATAGVDVTLEIWEGAVHVFQAFAPFVPEAEEAIASLGEYVRKRAH